jgi:hypothetical protein
MGAARLWPFFVMKLTHQPQPFARVADWPEGGDGRMFRK